MQRKFRDGIVLLAAIGILGVSIKSCVVEAFKVPSNSMSETIEAGDYLLINKFIYGARTPSSIFFIPLPSIQFPAVTSLQRGDIVALVAPTDPFHTVKLIKRCIGISGDTIKIQEGRLTVNNEEFPLRYYFEEKNFGPVVVPPDSFFVMGDNVNISSDSREWGCVPMKNLIGKAALIYWSKGERGIRWNRIGRMVK
ncbi:MAG: signal peptidase I [Bacteroidetes bacterium]|nr:signal peptidase I [Bacteroidota bacterium]